MVGNIKGIIDKAASRKLGVTAVAGTAAATGAVEITWPIGAIAMANIRADGSGYVGRVRQGRGVKKTLGVAIARGAGTVIWLRLSLSFLTSIPIISAGRRGYM